MTEYRHYIHTPRERARQLGSTSEFLEQAMCHSTRAKTVEIQRV